MKRVTTTALVVLLMLAAAIAIETAGYAYYASPTMPIITMRGGT